MGEINVRANEECNVEVLKMVDREKAKFREYYKQQEKRVEIDAKIQKQQMLEKYRMQHLVFQQKKLDELKELAAKRFSGITSDKRAYEKFLKDSMIQCFYKIWDESSVVVHCRSQDKSLVQKVMKVALAEAKKAAEDATGKPLEMTVSCADAPLQKCSGGVVVTARGGKVMCNNTLDARLDVAFRTDLPYVREAIFNQEGLGAKAN